MPREKMDYIHRTFNLPKHLDFQLMKEGKTRGLNRSELLRRILDDYWGFLDTKGFKEHKKLEGG